MPREKEPNKEPKELTIPTADDLEEQEIDNEGEDEEEIPEADKAAEEDSETDENAESDAEKPQGSLDVAQKSLEEELGKVREDLAEAKARTEFLEGELDKARQEYGNNTSQLWTYQGKHIYELTDKEYEQALDLLLEGANNADTDQSRRGYLNQIRDCQKLRHAGATLNYQEAVIEGREIDQWNKEWGIVETALLKEYPGLKAHVQTIGERIVPIFKNRKTDSDSRFLYRKLTDGFRGKDSVEEKFRHAVKVIKELGLLKELDIKGGSVPTIGKATQNKVSGSSQKFTREQIEKMSLEEFERNEKAINEALRKRKIR